MPIRAKLLFDSEGGEDGEGVEVCGHSLAHASVSLEQIFLEWSSSKEGETIPVRLGDFSKKEIEAFASLLKIGGKEGAAFSTKEVSSSAPLASKIAHVWGCEGILTLLQGAQNEHPSLEGVLSLLSLESEERGEWMSPSTVVFLMREIFSPKPFCSNLRQANAKKASRIPDAVFKEVVARFFLSHPGVKVEW